MHRVLWVGVVAASALLFGACSDSETTEDGAGGSGNTSSDGGSASGSGGSSTGGMTGTGGSMQGAGGGGMCLEFGAACNAGVDTCCDAAGETGECFTFGMGPRCTIPCPADPNDCPAGEGCNNQTPAKCKTE